MHSIGFLLVFCSPAIIFLPVRNRPTCYQRANKCTLFYSVIERHRSTCRGIRKRDLLRNISGCCAHSVIWCWRWIRLTSETTAPGMIEPRTVTILQAVICTSIFKCLIALRLVFSDAGVCRVTPIESRRPLVIATYCFVWPCWCLERFWVVFLKRRYINIQWMNEYSLPIASDARFHQRFFWSMNWASRS